MALWSSDCFLPPHKPLSISIHSISSSHRRFIIVSSSKSPSPVLEISSDDKALELTNEAIKALCSNPDSAAIVLTYQRARTHPDFKLTRKTLDQLIVALLSSQQWSSILSLSEDFMTYGVFPGVSICARLITNCIQFKKFKLAESLLGVLANNHATALPAFSAAMRGYNKLHMYSSTVAAFDRMTAVGISPDPSCYLYAMDAYRKQGEAEKVLSLFLNFQSSNSMSSVFTARIYSVLCDSLGRSGRAFEALTHFREMLTKGIPPQAPLYASLIKSFAEIREAEIVEDLFREAMDQGKVRDASVFMKLVSMYVAIGSVEKTIVVVEAMGKIGIEPSDCILCTVISGFVKQRGLRSSVRAYTKLISLGCQPGQVSYASMINVYCSLALTENAEALFTGMMDKGFTKCVVAYSNMISMYGKIGRVNDAMRLLAKMKAMGCEPNIWVYNSLLDINAKLLDLKEVKKLWSEMKGRGVEPDRVSYTSIISGHFKAGEFEECMVYFREFKENGGKVDRVFAGVMVGVFSKSGRVDELLKMLQDMKMEGRKMDVRLYKSTMNVLRDAGLQTQLKWFEESFGFKKGKK